jgi:hypothetical protein
MVQAILDEIKTQTRRVITRLYRLVEHGGPILGGKFVGESGNKNNPLGFMTGCGIERPKYQIGDILWVQETWRFAKDYECGRQYDVEFKDGAKHTFRFECADRAEKWKKYVNKRGWQSPYFMPYEAARIWLLVTDVKGERLQDITDKDIKSEGVSDLCLPSQRHKENESKWMNGRCTECAYLDMKTGLPISGCSCSDSAKRGNPITHYTGTGCTWGFKLRSDKAKEPLRWRFMYLWDSLQYKRMMISKYPHGCWWRDNPNVWVYCFKRTKCPLATAADSVDKRADAPILASAT